MFDIGNSLLNNSLKKWGVTLIITSEAEAAAVTLQMVSRAGCFVPLSCVVCTVFLNLHLIVSLSIHSVPCVN